MKTIILAGGYATRLLPITQDRPKPLLPVAGKPIIDYILASGSLPGRPIVSTNRRFVSQFEAWQANSGWDVDLVAEQTTSEEEKLGTVGAMAYLVEKLWIDEDILVIGGDNIFEFAIEDLLSTYKGHPLVALFDLRDLDQVRGRYGVAIVEDDRIVDFQEKPRQPKSTLASTACYIYPKQVLPLISEFYGKAGAGKDAPGYLNEWLLKRKGLPIDPFIFDTGWYDIGDRSSYIEANQHYSGSDTYTGKNVVIDSSTVKDSVILDNVTIKDCEIAGCVIDNGCFLEGVTLQNCLVKAGSIIRQT
jgi:glucose-1-phosphate thymidylyltransferase